MDTLWVLVGAIAFYQFFRCIFGNEEESHDRRDGRKVTTHILECRNPNYDHPPFSSSSSVCDSNSSSQPCQGTVLRTTEYEISRRSTSSSQSVQSSPNPVKSSFTSGSLPSQPHPSSTKPSPSSQSVQSSSNAVNGSFTSASLPSQPQSSLKSSTSSAKSSGHFSTAQNPSSRAHSSLGSPEQVPTFKSRLSSTSVEKLEKKDHFTFSEKEKLDIYNIPEGIRNLIKNNIVPPILKQPLSPLTYKDYFAALLYAEEFYLEKWSDFLLKDVTLEVDRVAVHKKLEAARYSGKGETEEEIRVVKFKINSMRDGSPSVPSTDMVYAEPSGCEVDGSRLRPERRPFLLSRDLVYAQPVGSTVEPLQGVIHRVEKSSIVLVEFKDDFYRQHSSFRRYNISFSFNRVCLKRAHQAIEAASSPSFKNFIFPDHISGEIVLKSPALFPLSSKLDEDQISAIRNIVRYQGPLPYLVKGPLLCEGGFEQLSRTGLVVKEAIIQIYNSYPASRVLVCAPINRACDVLTISLKDEIPESDIFRANAAFREFDGVPEEVLPSCTYKGECFSCPPLTELAEYRVIVSTYISSYRLHNEGLDAGHFSHIFLVDASSATEPELMVAMSNFADQNVNVLVTGASVNNPGRLRSEIARKHGLRVSYFERILECRPYKMQKSTFMTDFDDYNDRPGYLF